MWTEFLRLKPRLDPGDASRMEKSLSQRFARVAKTFGVGLRAVIRGSIFGISLGLLNRLLNPLEALEERIKGLLGQGKSTQELADRLGTTPGKLAAVELMFQQNGVSSEQFREAVTKYAQAVEQGRKEIAAGPFEQRSDATIALGDEAVKQTDIVGGFIDFLQRLQLERRGGGRDVFFGEKEQRRAAERALRGEELSDEERADLTQRGLMRRLTGEESAQEFERQILGEELRGALKRVVTDDLLQKNVTTFDDQALEAAFKKTADLADLQMAQNAVNNMEAFLNAADKIGKDTVLAMELRESQKQANQDAMLGKPFKDLEKASEGVEILKNEFVKLSNALTPILAEFGLLIRDVRQAGGLGKILRNGGGIF